MSAPRFCSFCGKEIKQIMIVKSKSRKTKDVIGYEKHECTKKLK